MAERELRRRQPSIFREVIGNLENSNQRNFEKSCEDFHRILENILDAKSKPNGNGNRETDTIRIKSRKLVYDFWIAEESSNNGESKNIVIKARPVSEFVVGDHIVIRASVSGEIEDVPGERTLAEGDYDEVKRYTEMLKYMQDYLPDPQKIRR